MPGAPQCRPTRDQSGTGGSYMPWCEATERDPKQGRQAKLMLEVPNWHLKSPSYLPSLARIAVTVSASSILAMPKLLLPASLSEAPTR